MSLSIARVSFEHHREALGIDETAPRISWRFNGSISDWQQTSYDLEITRDSNSPKTFTVDSSESLYAPWPDTPLGEAESATVRVRAHGSSSETPWSDWVHVETGLQDDTWADIDPITTLCQQPTDGPKRPIYFRKDFDVPADLVSARLYITALGLYEASIDGSRVGDRLLAPGWQSYNHRHVYDTYDVTAMLAPGERSALGAVVGEGWYAGRLGWGGGTRNIYGDTLGLLGVLVMTREDGSTIRIPTDASWQSLAKGPITSSEIYHGEHFDDRIAAKVEGWATPDFNATEGWTGTRSLDAPKGRLVAPDQPPVRATQEVKPQRVFKSSSGATLVDFGQNLVGWLRVTVTGPAGHMVQLRHAEVLEDGELGRRPLREAWQEDQILLSGREITYEPKFTFHGFRYAQVDGWPADTPLDGDHLTAVVVHTDMEPTGDFSCSHDLLNKFHSNVRWSMRGNFLSIPTDCPQRDERMGWTGDAHMFGPTSNFLYDTAGFWRSWHRDVWSEMSANGKMIPFAYTPTIPAGFGDQMPTAVWGDVVVAGPWNLYRAFGDALVLKEQLPQAQNWIDKGVKRSAEGGLWDRSTFQFGDWLDPSSPPSNPAQSLTHAHLVADAYLVQMTGLLADILEALGGDSEKYRAQRDELRRLFQAAWMSDDGRMANTTQTAYALGLDFDLFDGEDDLATGIEVLRQLVADNNYLVGTGFAGTAPLGRALSAANATNDFYRMLLQEQSPSWLYQVVMGGTTTWERWDSLLPDGSLNPGEMLSFNHYAFGSVADWIHQNIGGIAAEEPGYKRIRVAPVPGGDITSAKAEFVSPYGRVATDWEVDADGFRLTLEVPPNSRATVVMPGSGETVDVGSGRHEFRDAEFRMP
jgi:alpha-L-rhamnosidase